MKWADVLTLVYRAPAILFATIFMGSLSLITSLWDKTGNTQHRIARGWSRMLLTVGGVRAEVVNVERLNPARSYVLVSNHASLMDTPLVLASIPLQFRFLAKLGLFKIPFLGTHLRRAGHLPVERENPRASLKTMSDGAKLIRDRKVSVLLFPEGGRSEKNLRVFKEGAAYIAIKAGVPIVPLGIVGTRDVLPMHSSRFQPGVVRLLVGEPIETAQMTIRDRGALTETLRARVSELSETPYEE